MIDAVVTWVNGADKEHTKKRLAHMESMQRHLVDKSGMLPTRFNSVGEIDFCLRSLLQNAPWLRTIYIVTDGQTPSILKTFEGTPYAERFQVIDHRDIFRGFEQYLPTFNSLTIESMLWRIPGLSEQFIYLNDDCFVLRPVDEDAFFQDGKPVLRGHWKAQKAYKWKNVVKRFLGVYVPKKKGSRVLQENGATLAGFSKKYFHLQHVPFPLLKQTFVNFFKDNPEVLLKNLQYPFRHPEQFNSVSVVYHLGLKMHQVVFDKKSQFARLNIPRYAWRKIKAKLDRASRDSNIRFVCIQSLDQATPEIQSKIIHWLDKHISLTH